MRKLTQEEHNKATNIATGVAITVGVLAAAAFIALVVLFPPAAALGLGAVLMYVTSIISTTVLLGFLAHMVSGKLYSPEPYGIRDPGRSGRSMRASHRSVKAAQDDAERGKSMMQQCCAMIAVMVVPTALFVGIMTAPFAITILVATVITGLTVGGLVGSVAGAITGVACIYRYGRQSSDQLGSLNGSTARSQKSLGINGIQTRTTYKPLKDVDASSTVSNSQLQGAPLSFDAGVLNDMQASTVKNSR